MILLRTCFLAIICGALFSACSSGGAYKPANSFQSSGYREQALSEDQWLVSYRVRGQNSTEAYRLALKRAAELTVEQGYDWFEVINRREEHSGNTEPRSSIGLSRRYETHTDCGLLTCRSRVQPSTESHLSIAATERRSSLSEIEIRMGKGLRPDLGNVYLAGELR